MKSKRKNISAQKLLEEADKKLKNAKKSNKRHRIDKFSQQVSDVLDHLEEAEKELLYPYRNKK